MKTLKSIATFILSGIVMLMLCISLLFASQVGIAIAAKAIYQTDLGPDDIYEAFQSVVTDMTSIKSAVDDITGSSGTDVIALALLTNEIAADVETNRLWMLSVTSLYNAHMANTIAEGIHNGVVGELVTNTIASDLTAPLVTPTAVSNAVGTLGTTIP